MILLFIFLAFSLFVFLPVKMNIAMLKSKSKDYIQSRLSFFVFDCVAFKIPVSGYTIKNIISLLAYKHNEVDRFKNIPFKNTYKSKKQNIISDNILYKIITFVPRTFLNDESLKKMYMSILKKVNIEDLNIDIDFSSENAAITGILNGLFWSVVCLGLAVFSTYVNLDAKKIKIAMTPNFINEKSLELKINCIFRLRVGHIIIASFIAIWRKLLVEKSSSQKIS